MGRFRAPVTPIGQDSIGDTGAAFVLKEHNGVGRAEAGRSVRPDPIPGVEIREGDPRGGGTSYAYRVRFRDARGRRVARTFDCAEDALDFRARLRLLKRADELGELDRGRETLAEFLADFWRLYAEVHLEPSTRRKYRCLWRAHIEQRLGAMQLRRITPVVICGFIRELQDDGTGAPTIRSCLGLLQSMFARAVEWDRARVNVVKLIAKPRVRRARAIEPLRPVDVEALRREMLRHPKHGLRDATLVSVLAYAGLRPEETLALEYEHVRARTILVEQEWVDGEILIGQKTKRPPRFPPLLDVLRADVRELELADARSRGLIFARADGTPWRDHDWRDWRARVWQPACQAIGLATITNTTIVEDGRRRTKRTYDGPVPYDLRHSFASLLIREGEHSIVQIAEWMGHSPATLLSHYAHVLADGAGESVMPGERAIRSARRARAIPASSSTAGDGRTVAEWTIRVGPSRTAYYSKE
jgi:integrase